MCIHSSFFASTSASLLCCSQTSLRYHIDRNSLGVIDPASSRHSILRGFHQCREALATCGARKEEDIAPNPPPPPKDLPPPPPILPAASSLWSEFPPSDPMTVPHIPPQRNLTKVLRSSHPAFSMDRVTEGGTPADVSRIAHVSQSTAKAQPPPTSPLHAFLPKDDTLLAQAPLSWLRVVAGSAQYDSFPRFYFIAFMSLYLGLPIPSTAYPAPPCKCGAPLDAAGHHRMCCPRANGATLIWGHDRANNALLDLARSCNVGANSSPHAVPSHSGQKRADLAFALVTKSGSASKQLVGDISIRHPVIGAPRDADAIGTWLPTSMEDRYKAKNSKHERAYTGMGLLFTPLVASTYGVLHPEFLRLLWILAGAHDGDLEPGEVREIAHTDPRHHVFFKLRARVTATVAYATAMRLVGVPGAVHRPPPPRQFYDPSDPTFSGYSSLNGLPLGALPLDV